MQLFLSDEQATITLGRELAQRLPQDQAFVIYLEGNLGAGKTTFCRALLNALGHTGKVKSPTYTLVERYQIGQRDVFHFDLYRLADPEELLFLGLEDYFDNHALCLIEWPEQGGKLLPTPDLSINLSYADHGRQVELTPHTAIATAICETLHK